jgi:hypothetical protein
MGRNNFNEAAPFVDRIAASEQEPELELAMADLATEESEAPRSEPEHQPNPNLPLATARRLGDAARRPLVARTPACASTVPDR